MATTNVYEIKVNGTKLRFTVQRGHMKLTEDSIGEQCQDCGHDLMETGEYEGRQDSGAVFCTCGTTYEARIVGTVRA